MIDDLDSRKQLWTAFSNLWLDTEIQPYTLNSIAIQMRQSGYSLDELSYIYQHEVAPVVYQNLLVSAGVWDGFNEEWLHSKILEHIANKNRWSKLGFFIKKPLMFYATKHYWATLENLFQQESIK